MRYDLQVRRISGVYSIVVTEYRLKKAVGWFTMPFGRVKVEDVRVLFYSQTDPRVIIAIGTKTMFDAESIRTIGKCRRMED